MGGLFGSTTISTTDTRINSMRIQQSAYGLCQPLVYGKTRVAANMFWYGDFTATPHTTVQKSGGKGGGTKPVILPLVIAPLSCSVYVKTRLKRLD